MNFCIYYLNSAGYPQFFLVSEKSKKDAIKSFKTLHPEYDVKEIFVAVNDMTNWLICNL